MPKKSISHKCIICSISVKDEFCISSNLTHHLRRHCNKNIELKNWFESNEKIKSKTDEIENNLDQHIMNLVKI